MMNVLFLFLSLVSHAASLPECAKPANAEWRAFCLDPQVQKIYESTMASRARFAGDDSARELYNVGANWPTALIEACHGKNETCARDTLLRYMMRMTPQLEKLKKAQKAPAVAAAPTDLVKSLVGTYKQKNKFSVQLLEARPGVLFIEALFYGPMSSETGLPGSQCRYIGGATFKSGAMFELAEKAFTGPFCHLQIEKKAGEITFTSMDDPCEDFCGQNVFKKVQKIPFSSRGPVEDEKYYRENSDEFKDAAKP